MITIDIVMPTDGFKGGVEYFINEMTLISTPVTNCAD